MSGGSSVESLPHMCKAMSSISDTRKNSERKKNNAALPSRILHLAELSFRNEEEVKIFSGKQKLREFITYRPALLQMLMELLKVEKKGC
jgi:hypothetical protein